MSEFVFQARVIYRAAITVEADNIEDARALAGQGIWVDDGHAGAELVDWDITSKGQTA